MQRSDQSPRAAQVTKREGHTGSCLIPALVAQTATEEDDLPERVEGQLLVVWKYIFLYVNKWKYMLIEMGYLAGLREPHLAATKEVIPKEYKLRKNCSKT